MESPPHQVFVWTSDQPTTEDLDEFVAHLLTGKEQRIFDRHYGNFGPRAGVDYRDADPGASTFEWIELDEEETDS